MATIPLMYAEEDVEYGGKESIEDDFAYNNNVAKASLKIRMGFLRKVYGLLSIQLFITLVVGAICMLQPDVRSFIHTNSWMMMGAFILSIITLVALHIKRKESPTNLILLAAFTFVQAYTVGVVLTFYDQAVVLQALVLTVTVVTGLSAFTFQTKRDFSSMGYGLFVGLSVLIVAGILQIFIGSSMLELIISIGGAFLFCIFIIFDTQMMMTTLSPEEYILATINLYLDIINLFLYILRALQAARQ